ncbi:hypothetical protein HDV02_000042 [Globomyces sp. JEL0801]|nr:hypothetical protein HDV02_000042 [Globomyces sp. JEL0801]
MEELTFKKSKKPKKTIRKRLNNASDEENDGTDTVTISASDLKKSRKKSKVEDLQKNEQIDDSMTHLGVAFKSSGTAVSLVENTAFRRLDVDGRDGETLNADQLDKSTSQDGLYQGLNSYNEFINKKQEKVTQSNAGGLRAGPLRAVSNVKISCRFDYAAGICKDYKETGWQLDQQWEEDMKKAEEERNPNRFHIENEVEEEEIDSDDDLPFACLICRGDFKSPIVTKCKHYFCESCALKHFAKTPGCFACSLNTQGVFNNAKDILPKVEAKKKRMAEREAEIREAMAAEEEQD